jgi:glycosyltransferase involved in cell wall biosynthesis
MSGVRLSLVIPSSNSEGFIADMLAQAITYLERRREPYELIVVDDGRADDSAATLAELAARHCSVQLIRNGTNIRDSICAMRDLLRVRLNALRGRYA